MLPKIAIQITLEVAKPANNEIKILESQISNMRESLAANTKAALREQEKKNKLDFYKISESINMTAVKTK